MGSSSLGGIEGVPAAFSVKVVGNGSLLNATGVTYIGRMKTTYSGPDPADGRSAQDLADALWSYAPLKGLSNAELIQHAKQVNAIPTNVVDLSNFTQILDDGDGTTAWDGSKTAMSGFAPIVIYNPTKASLMVEVCTEWRIRLDPFNPLHSSGIHHTPTHPGVWHAITDAAEKAGHGVEDVVEYGAGAAAGGMALATAAQSAGLLGGLEGAFASALPTLEYLAPLLLL